MGEGGALYSSPFIPSLFFTTLLATLSCCKKYLKDTIKTQQPPFDFKYAWILQMNI